MIIKEAVNNRHEKTFTALGTLNAIAAYGVNGEEALEAAFKRVVEIEQRMSVFINNSDIVKLNKNSGIKPQVINPDTFQVLKRAVEFSRASKGAFDITIRPLTSLWGFGTKDNYLPAREEIEAALPLVNYEDLLLEEEKCTAYLSKKGAAIDLGGIAKGYAADEVREILLKHGIKDALINLGGNIVAMGNNPAGAPWRIGIQNPLSSRGQYIGTVKVVNKTIVTSGSNEQFFIKDGVRYHHIIDPRTGYPADNKLLSVTVLCEGSLEADAVTTALFIMDLSEAVTLLKSIGAEAVFIMENKDIFLTEGLRGQFERT